MQCIHWQRQAGDHQQLLNTGFQLHTVTTTTVSFCLTALFSGEDSGLGQFPQRLSKLVPLQIADAVFFTGQLPFWSPNQHFQSTEERQTNKQTAC